MEKERPSLCPLLCFLADKIFRRRLGVAEFTFFLSANSTKMCFQPSSSHCARLCSRPFLAELHCPQPAGADICQKSRPPSRIFRLQLGGWAGRANYKAGSGSSSSSWSGRHTPPVVGETLPGAGLRWAWNGRRLYTSTDRSSLVPWANKDSREGRTQAQKVFLAGGRTKARVLSLGLKAGCFASLRLSFLHL